MRVLVDLNVILDVLQNRQPFYQHSARVLDAIVQQKVEGWLAAHSLTTLFYVISRQRDRETAVTALKSLLTIFTVASVNEQVIHEALSWDWTDFEDAVQMAAAVHANVNYLVTRNPGDFQNEPVPVILPAALLPLLKKL